jgi:plastocyanin
MSRRGAFTVDVGDVVEWFRATPRIHDVITSVQDHAAHYTRYLEDRSVAVNQIAGRELWPPSECRKLTDQEALVWKVMHS